MTNATLRSALLCSAFMWPAVVAAAPTVEFSTALHGGEQDAAYSVAVDPTTGNSSHKGSKGQTGNCSTGRKTGYPEILGHGGKGRRSAAGNCTDADLSSRWKVPPGSQRTLRRLSGLNRGKTPRLSSMSDLVCSRQLDLGPVLFLNAG
jgi:hypothetical protein